VTSWPVKAYAEPTNLLLRYLDGVETPFVDDKGESAKLPQRIANAREQLRMRLHQEASTVISEPFLVANDGQHNITRQLHLLGFGPQHGAKYHGHSTLHIQRTTTPNIAFSQHT
jgi:hypothetical protein